MKKNIDRVNLSNDAVRIRTDEYLAPYLKNKTNGPIDQRPEPLTDADKTYFTSGTKNDTFKSTEKKKVYDQKEFKYSDKHLMILNHINENDMKTELPEYWKIYYEDAKNRARFVADYLQAESHVPLMTRKLTRSKIKVNSVQFPINPKNSVLNKIEKAGHSAYSDKKTKGVIPSDGSGITQSTDTYFSVDNVILMLNYFCTNILHATQILEDIFNASKIKKPGSSTAEVEVIIPTDVKRILSEDMTNAVIFITKCLHQAQYILKNHLDDDSLNYACYPVCKSGCTTGDYSYIFGFVILSWIYNALKTKNPSKTSKTILESLNDIKTKGVETVLKKKISTLDGSKINTMVEKYKSKLTSKASDKAVYSLAEYYKPVKDENKQAQNAKNVKRTYGEEMFDVEIAFSNEVNQIGVNREEIKKNQIIDHVFIYPNVGRKILLYTDINHFKYDFGESTLSGIGMMMELGLLPDNIFDSLKLCSLLTGGIFSLKLNKQTNELDFKYNKNKLLPINMSDSEFIKYAQVIDMHPMYNGALGQGEMSASFPLGLYMFDIENNRPLKTQYGYNHTRVIGDFDETILKTYEKFRYTKIAHIFGLSSDKSLINNYLIDIIDHPTNHFDWAEFKKEISQSDAELISDEDFPLLNMNQRKGDKLPFHAMRKIPNVREGEVKDAIKWDLLRNHYIILGKVPGINYKRQESMSLYNQSRDGTISVKTLSYNTTKHQDTRNAADITIQPQEVNGDYDDIVKHINSLINECNAYRIKNSIQNVRKDVFDYDIKALHRLNKELFYLYLNKYKDQLFKGNVPDVDQFIDDTFNERLKYIKDVQNGQSSQQPQVPMYQPQVPMQQPQVPMQQQLPNQSPLISNTSGYVSDSSSQSVVADNYITPQVNTNNGTIQSDLQNQGMKQIYPNTGMMPVTIQAPIVN